MKNYEDEILISFIIKDKNTDAFEELYDRYKNMVFNRVFNFVGNIEDAKDLTQDIFLKCFVKLHSFEGNSKFSSWLYALTYNHCVNYIQRNQSHKIKHNSIDYEKVEYIIGDDSEKILFQIPVDILKLALEKINAEEKSLLLLKYQDDLSIKDLQNLYHISESAVKMRLKRARTKILKVYKSLKLETHGI